MTIQDDSGWFITIHDDSWQFVEVGNSILKILEEEEDFVNQ